MNSVLIPFFRCISCNSELNKSESARRGVASRRYIGLCNRCFAPVEDEIPYFTTEESEKEQVELNEELAEDNDGRLEAANIHTSNVVGDSGGEDIRYNRLDTTDGC